MIVKLNISINKRLGGSREDFIDKLKNKVFEIVYDSNGKYELKRITVMSTDNNHNRTNKQ